MRGEYAEVMRIPSEKSVSFAPFVEELKGYSLGALRWDLFAAVSVALMTIPQSIAYSLLAGLPPTAGLFAAIFGSIFAGALGSSRYLVAGPSTGTAILIQTALSDVLYSYVAEVAGPPPEALMLQILMQIVLLVGLMQIAAAFFNVNKLLQFVSRPVVLGYFAGITIAIGVTQLFALTGIAAPLGDQPILWKAWYFFGHVGQMKGKTVLLGVLSLGVFVSMRHWLRNWPNALMMLVMASIAAFALGEGTVATLRSLQLPQAPLPQWTVPLVNLQLLSKIFPSAVAIAFLGILEVFSISRTFAAKRGERAKINQDVFGLGIGNLFLSFVWGGMSASGSATRTSLNFRLNAKTRVAAVLSGVLTAVCIFFLWPQVNYVPLAALAALLIATVHTLMDWKEIRLSFRATKEDAWVFLLTFCACLVFRLDIAFFIGIVISIGTYLKKSSMPHLVEYGFNPKGRLMVVSPKEDPHRKVRIIGIGGDLYFGTADVFQAALHSITEDPNVQAIILRLNNVHRMDASMCLAILQLFETLQSSERYLIVSGLTEEVWQVFQRAGLVQKIGLDNFYFTDESNPQFSTWKAALRAQELIHQRLYS